MHHPQDAGPERDAHDRERRADVIDAASPGRLDSRCRSVLLFTMLVYVNGHFLPKDEATVSVFDHGFLYGDGIYETMRAYDGRIFLLSKHLSRLRHSAEAVSLTLPLTLDKIGDALKESLTVNKLQNAYIRLHISRGPGEIGLDPALCPAPTMVIVTKPFHDYPQELYEKGVRV